MFGNSIFLDLIAGERPGSSIFLDLIVGKPPDPISADCIVGFISTITDNIGFESEISDNIGVLSPIDGTGISVNSLIIESIAFNSFIEDNSLGFESTITDNIGFISTICDC